MYRPGGGASKLTWRLVQAFVEALPPESGCKTAAREELTEEQIAASDARDGYGPWSQGELLLAALHDQLSWLIYATYHAQGGKPQAPQPLPRPGVGGDPASGRPRAGRAVDAKRQAANLAALARIRAARGGPA